jgi:hypothetical protein
VEVRNAPTLKLQNPEITNTRCSSTESSKPGMQMLLGGFAVGVDLVVSQTELGHQGRRCMFRRSLEVRSGLGREHLNFSALDTPEVFRLWLWAVIAEDVNVHREHLIGRWRAQVLGRVKDRAFRYGARNKRGFRVGRQGNPGLA